MTDVNFLDFLLACKDYPWIRCDSGDAPYMVLVDQKANFLEESNEEGGILAADKPFVQVPVLKTF